MNPNTAQRLILIASAVIFVIMGLFPPWTQTLPSGTKRPVGYAPIFDPTSGPVFGPAILRFPDSSIYGGLEIDLPRMIAQWIMLSVATGAGVFLARDWRKDGNRKDGD